MKVKNSWIIAVKDFKIFKKKKQILYSLIVLPLIFSVALPFYICRLSLESSTNFEEIIIILNSLPTLFIILSSIMPTTLASYSIIGEKIENSLETLLATPITNEELLLGKIIASFLPCIISIYSCSLIFMFIIDTLTYGEIGYLIFPNWNILTILIITVPIACILSINLSIIISSKVNDLRTASQLGALIIIPFAALCSLFGLNLVEMNINNLLTVSISLFIIDILLFYLSKSIFQREELITKSK
jgi:ABC-type Na+ efflux pump permease subunit